jgi:hypothetical protein
MFVFVMSSGLGGNSDFFNWLPQWLGSKRGGDELCRIDGSKVTDRELNQLRFQRVMASRFMLTAAEITLSNLRKEELARLQRVTDDHSREVLTGASQAYQTLRDPRLRELFQSAQGPMIFRQFEQQIEAANRLAREPNTPPAEKEIVRILQFREQLAMQLEFSRGEEYFFNAPNRTQNDLINFAIWQKKADQYGISFTTPDIVNMIEHEFEGSFVKGDDVTARKMLQSAYPNFNWEACVRAIGEEFRVRTVQSLLLGPAMVYTRGDKTFGGLPVFTPPFELFDYYRTECSPTEYALLPVPDAGFLDKVTGQPTTEELDKLYKQYKDDEPNPARETPGFKTPRRVKLEWVSASGSEPYYQKLTEESLKQGELQAKIGSLFTIPLPGMSPGWVAAATAPLVPKNLLLNVDSVRTQYADKVRDHNMLMEGEWSMPFLGSKLLDTSVIRPPTLAAALGGAVGDSLTAAGPLPGVISFQSAVRSFEHRDRIRAEIVRVLSAVPVGPGLLATVVGGQAASKSLLPKPLSIETMEPELMKDLREQTAKQLVLNDLKTFIKDVEERVAKDKDAKDKEKDKDKAGLKKFIEEYIAKRGWQHGGSTTLDTEWTMEDDPGLAPLRDALAKSHTGNHYVPFGNRFFWQQAGNRGRAPSTGIYKPEYYPNPPSQFESPSAKPEPKFLVWRTEDLPAKPSPGFQADKDKVIAAWKQMKAREMAKAKAEALASAVRSGAGDTATLIEQNLNELANNLRNEIADPKARERVKVFQIKGVCPLTSLDPSTGSETMMLHRFVLDSTKDIPFPTKEMADTLLTERTKPPKTSFVLTDLPHDTYYVAVVLGRREQSPNEFRLMVYAGMPSMGAGQNPFAQTRQAVMQSFNVDAQKKTLDSVLAMLKKEFRYEATPEQQKKLEENAKRGGEA